MENDDELRAKYHAVMARCAALNVGDYAPLEAVVGTVETLHHQYVQMCVAIQERKGWLEPGQVTPVCPSPEPSYEEPDPRVARMIAAKKPRFVYDTGMVEEMSREFCTSLIVKLEALKQGVLGDMKNGSVTGPNRVEEVNVLLLDCKEFKDRLDADSCYFEGVETFTDEIF